MSDETVWDKIIGADVKALLIKTFDFSMEYVPNMIINYYLEATSADRFYDAYHNLLYKKDNVLVDFVNHI